MIRQLFSQTRLSNGQTLFDESIKTPLLIVFLRHFGCTFCREALADLAACKSFIEEKGTRLVLVHMASEDEGKEYFRRYQLSDCLFHSDPDCQLYEAFGLGKGSKVQLFGLKVWARGLVSGMLKGNGIGLPHQDPFQMPGVFLVFKGHIMSHFRHDSAADRPDYIRFLQS